MTGACAITGGAFYSPLTPQFPSEYSQDYFFADFCGGWIWRLDVASGSVTELRDRHRVAGRPQGLRRRVPVLSRARARTRCIASVSARARRPSRRIRRVGRFNPAPRSPSASGPRGPRRCAINGCATARHRGRHRAGLHHRRGRRGGRRRAVPRAGHQRLRQRAEQRGGPDGLVEPGAERDDHAACGRHALQRGHDHQLRGDRDRS